MTEAIRILAPHLSHGVLQCIATGTPEGLLLTIEKAEGLARHFEVIRVGPSSEDEALRVVLSAKEQLEKFHNVVFGEDAIRVATAASRRFLFGRQLPDRVIDLLDEAGARARMRRETESAELIALRQRIRRVARAVESAIANLDLERAREWAEEERSERQNLSRLRDEPAQKPVQGSTITPEREADGEWERIVKTLTAGISAEGHEWLACLASYLAGCSDEEAEKLAQAIRTARNTRKD